MDKLIYDDVYAYDDVLMLITLRKAQKTSMMREPIQLAISCNLADKDTS